MKIILENKEIIEKEKKRIYLNECNNELEKSLMILNKFPLGYLDIEKKLIHIVQIGDIVL